MKKLKHKSAFPNTVTDSPNIEESGMTYREWLVGIAMQGILANPSEFIVQGLETTSKNHNMTSPEVLAIMAIEQADATIKELEKNH